MTRQDVRRKVFEFADHFKKTRPEVAAYVTGTFLCFFEAGDRNRLEERDRDEAIRHLREAIDLGASRLCGPAAMDPPLSGDGLSYDGRVGTHDPLLWGEVERLLQEILEL